MRAFRALARIGAPRFLAAQKRLARNDIKLHHYRFSAALAPIRKTKLI
jgi:hypothetical protein